MFLGINLSYFFYFYLKYFKKQLINRRKKGICTSEKGVGGLFGKGNGGRWRWRRRRLRIKVHVVKVEARPLDSQLLYVRQRLGMGLYLCGIDNSTIFFTTLFIFLATCHAFEAPKTKREVWVMVQTPNFILIHCHNC